MATYNKGQVKFGTPGEVIDSTIPSRRLYDFSDRIAELAPDESPFFVYLSNVGKVPTSDSQFRFLEDRTKIHMTDKSFFIDGAQSLAAQGSPTNVLIEAAAGSSTSAGNVNWLIPGMVVQFATNVNSEGGGAGDVEAITQATAVINSVTQNDYDTTINVTTIEASSGGTTALDDEGKGVVIGTSYLEGTGAPDVFSQKLDNGFGYTQIFKTACEMSNTARATVYRGYADEWARIWNMKLREHKIDIERAMLFGMKASVGGRQYTDGIVGHIIKNGGTPANGVIGSYSESTPYLATYATSELTYDGLLTAFETMYDPARGGSDAKLALCSLPVISHFNKIAGFGELSMSGETRYNFESAKGVFGHNVTIIDTVHGSVTLVKEPLFRDNASGHMCFVDLENVSYRPLVGNGINRDTQIETHVEAPDEDLRKDMILTEAGLEVSLPESHALINVEGL